MNRDEIDAWDEQLVSNPDGGNIFQMAEVAEVKRLGGWTPRYREFDGLAITIHEKPVFGLGKLWYLPKGPGVSSIDQLSAILPAIEKAAKKAGAFVVKIEPEFKKSEVKSSDLAALNLIHVNPIQPNDSTVILDLTGSLDEIMAGLNQKGRHAIHRAERDGVTAEAVPFTDENARTMYALLCATAEGKFNTRSFEYYHAFWQNLVNTGRGQLFFASFEGKIIAGAFSAYLGHKGTYKDGASVRERTAYGASHLLQWEIIKWMKDHNVTSYDLCGTPSSDQILDESHPHYGLGRFKTSFNKEVTDYVGAYDLPILPLAYRIWSSVGERIVIRLNRAIKHEYWY